jgi:uncharacterized hydrophobic protein (TIGR00271 family)
VPVLLTGCRRGGQRERAALGVPAHRPPIAGVDDRATELTDALERLGQVGDGDVGQGGRVAERPVVEFMMIAALIAAVGILIDSPILIVGAMVVGPEFGPIAGICVAIVQRRRDLATRSATALAVGTAAAIAATVAWSLFFKWTGIDSDGPGDVCPLTEFISNPDFFSFFVADLAGTAGVLSLISAKSGALIGVLISVTTIPAIANIGVATAYTDWAEVGGAAAQLGVNLVALVLVGLARLTVQRRVYEVRLKRHLSRSATEP